MVAESAIWGILPSIFVNFVLKVVLFTKPIIWILATTTLILAILATTTLILAIFPSISIAFGHYVVLITKSLTEIILLSKS